MLVVSVSRSTVCFRVSADGYLSWVSFCMKGRPNRHSESHWQVQLRRLFTDERYCVSECMVVLSYNTACWFAFEVPAASSAMASGCEACGSW